MVLTRVPIFRNSPFRGLSSISNLIFFVKSPSATAVITRPTSIVGCAKLLISELMESIFVFHKPVTFPKENRSDNLPSSPTILLIRIISFARLSLMPTTSLNIIAISAIMPSLSMGNLTEKSPSFIAFRALNNRSLSLWTALRSTALLSASAPPCSCNCSSFSVSSKNTDRPGLRVSFGFAISTPPFCFGFGMCHNVFCDVSPFAGSIVLD